jgi:predicted RNA binding protein YcfA (HicA-like mRNA interferase family)
MAQTMAPWKGPSLPGIRISDCDSFDLTPYTLVSVKVRDIIRMVEQDGWIQVRQKGSHRQYHHPSKAGTVTVAGHPSMDLDPKTERSILKQAGLNQ